MRPLFSLIFGLCIALLVAGCTTPPATTETPATGPTTPEPTAPSPPAPQQPAVLDCGTDAECFLPHLRDCTPARASTETQTATKYFEITGQKEQFYCNVHLITASLNVVEEDCVAYTKQELYGGYGYYQNQRSMTYFELKECTNRKVVQ